MRLSDLQIKDVINILDGKNLGRIVDAEIDDQGQILYFVVEKMKHLAEVGIVTLEKTERSSLAEKAAKLL